jgi:aspartate/methionine/tyrosine aminotransferase
LHLKASRITRRHRLINVNVRRLKYIDDDTHRFLFIVGERCISILRVDSMKKMISLGGGEPEYRTPEHIVEAMKRAMDEGHTHYGDFRHIPELREAVAARYRRMGVDVDAERVIITPGSTMGIYMAYKALMDPGEEFLTMDPCFFGYYDSVDLFPKDEGSADLQPRQPDGGRAE